jgi:predicted dehydrogenase
MAKKVKVGIIGCGKIAQALHVPALLNLKGKAVVSGLYDPNQRKAKRLNKDHGLEAVVYRSLGDLLASDIDAVIVSSPNTTHFPISMQALESGMHLLVEKPMAVSLAEAKTMIREAGKRKRVLQVNQTLRFTPAYCKIKELIDAGTIGEVMHCRCLRAHAESPDKGWSKGAKWFVQKKFRGGLVMDIAVHMADFLAWCSGPVKTVYARNVTRAKGIDVPDNVTALLEFANGSDGVLELSWTTPVGGGYLEFYGTKGTLRMGFQGEVIELLLPGKKSRIVKPRKVKNSHQCFIEAINGVAPSPVSGQVGLSALAICLAMETSGQSHRPEKVRLK